MRKIISLCFLLYETDNIWRNIFIAAIIFSFVIFLKPTPQIATFSPKQTKQIKTTTKSFDKIIINDKEDFGTFKEDY